MGSKGNERRLAGDGPGLSCLEFRAISGSLTKAFSLRTLDVMIPWMSIPAFDGNNVLPPHTGDPRKLDQLSPYPCTTSELCRRFATSPECIAILDGLLRFRAVLGLAGFVTGFQWLDGSFLEAIEVEENRPPKDLDVVTFYIPAHSTFNATVAAEYPILRDRNQIKATFHLDHFPFDIAHNPLLTVEWTRYWTGLFSHRRDGVWKGMLRVDLNTPIDDSNARGLLPGVT